MKFFSKNPTIITHDGRFHADDIFACATLQIVLQDKGKIVRTRDPKYFENSDYVVDVGGIYDPQKKRFDHHQIGGAGVRQNGVPYAAFGLVWKEYGTAIAGSPEAAARVEEKLVCAIDAGDNAYETFVAIPDRPFPYLINSFFSSFMPTWKEGDITDIQFIKLVSIAKTILLREITHAKDRIEAETQIGRLYQEASDKRLI